MSDEDNSVCDTSNKPRTSLVEIIYDPQKKIFSNTVTGELTLSDIEKNVADILAHPDFRPGANTLWDLRKARIAELSSNQLMAVDNTDLFREDLDAEPKFAVVTADPLQFGLARQLISIIFSEVSNVEVFHSMDEAETWLTRE